ncbi:MAG: CobW family GTP-binding protein [Christensenellales bacterium]|nr:CobW family GTP-binding protein [Christensenellales bacterium]
MTKVTIISGVLGAGKTTLIKKLLDGAFSDEKVVLLENEYGEVGIDGGFMKNSGIQITELNSGCICCTLVGDFSEALKELVNTYHPDRILIEPSGVGKLSDIRRVVNDAAAQLELTLSGCVTVADVTKCRLYIKNFGEFFLDQIQSAETILLSRTQNVDADRIEKSIALLREHNGQARIVTTPWDQLEPAKVLEIIETPDFLLTVDELFAEQARHHHHEECCCGGHHDHHHHEECCCDGHHDHHHHDECDCGGHHDHHHHDECGCGGHHDHHHHDECGCGGHHDHHHHAGCGCGGHHHDHHADEVFENLGVETPRKFDEAALRDALGALEDEKRFGAILRAKGILPLTDGKWLHFDYVPGEADVRYGAADYTGRMCVIGCGLNAPALRELFGI